MVLKLLVMLPQLANVTECVRVVSAMMLSPGYRLGVTIVQKYGRSIRQFTKLVSRADEKSGYPLHFVPTSNHFHVTELRTH